MICTTVHPLNNLSLPRILKLNLNHGFLQAPIPTLMATPQSWFKQLVKNDIWRFYSLASQNAVFSEAKFLGTCTTHIDLYPPECHTNATATLASALPAATRSGSCPSTSWIVVTTSTSTRDFPAVPSFPPVQTCTSPPSSSPSWRTTSRGRMTFSCLLPIIRSNV